MRFLGFITLCLILFFVPSGHAFAAPQGSLALEPGEARIRATVFSALRADGRYLLAAESHTPPGGETTVYRNPRRITLTLAPDCFIGLGDTPGSVADIAPGFSVLVVGFESEGGKNIIARIVRVGAKSSLNVPTPQPTPAPAFAPTRTKPGALPALGTIAPSFSAAKAISPAVEYDGVSRQSVLIPLVFPVLGRTDWQDTFLASRGGGSRRHHGQDLMTPKMTKLVACFDGTVRVSKNGLGGNALYIFAKNGWYAYYAHINNDTPGTNDGKGTAGFAFAPGIATGTLVRAGQFVAYSGNSGNAESTAPHLHFELRKGGAVFNAAPSLAKAQKSKNTRPVLPMLPELLPGVEPEAVLATTNYSPPPDSSASNEVRPVLDTPEVSLKPSPAPFAWRENTRRLLDVLNFHRREKGLGELTATDALCFAAQAGSDAAQAEVRVHRFGTRAVSTAPLQNRLQAAGVGISPAIEVFAVGTDDADKTAFVWFLRGGADVAALLSPDKTRIGIGFTPGERGRCVWNVILAGE